MLILKRLLHWLRLGFNDKPSFVIAVILLSLLDPFAFLGLLWFFLFQNVLAVESEILLRLALVYVILCICFGFVSIRSKNATLKYSTMFYLSVGLFFILKGWFGISGKTFSPFPWIILWVFSLYSVIQQFGREYVLVEKENSLE